MTPIEREKAKVKQLGRIEKKLDSILGILDDMLAEKEKETEIIEAKKATRKAKSEK